MEQFGLPDKQFDAVQARGIVLLPLQFVPPPGLIQWNLITQQNTELTLTASGTMANPVGIKKGRFYGLEVIQGGAGSFVITWSSWYKNVATLTLQTTAGYSNYLTFKAMTDTSLELVGNFASTRS